jgi:hypothetical protein
MDASSVVEPPLGYHPCFAGVSNLLAVIRLGGHSQVGSLTGAVAS